MNGQVHRNNELSEMGELWFVSEKLDRFSIERCIFEARLIYILVSTSIYFQKNFIKKK